MGSHTSNLLMDLYIYSIIIKTILRKKSSTSSLQSAELRLTKQSNREFLLVVTDHVLLQYVRVTFHSCPFLPTICGRLDWHVIKRSQKQELLGTYAFSISTIAVNQFSGWTVRVNLPPRLRLRE